MKLNTEITINPPPTSSKDKIVYPQPMTLTQLQPVYIDDPEYKIYYCNIKGFPNPIVLYSGQEYDSHENIGKNLGEARLREKLGDEPAKILRSLFPKTLEEHPNGPGTVLSQMIKSLGIVMTEGCSCRKHAIEMNENGNDWCEKNIDTIVSWLREESKKRKLPFIDAIGKLIVSRAIKKSRKLLANEPVPDKDEDLDNIA